ncbi:MAG: methyltransferase domain-containing protein [Rubrivivax sp.]|nr:methyltransferase domain-containing protein [Rubrivivax sp.]
MKTLSAKAFEAVTTMFHNVSGIKLGPHKQALVAGRLQRLAQEAGEPDVDAYVEKMLRGDTPAEEMTRLVDRLTTNETYFFREPQHFKDLEARIASRSPREPFLVWSAASSSGEEAYSVSMVLADKLGRQPWQVIGTDLSTSVVEAAQRGLYPLERARMVPPDYLKRYCLKGQGKHEGSLLVARELRERVRFLQANLMQPLPELPQFDVIFLRNVLIYFENDAKAQIVRRVLGQLKPDGVLYIGHAESMSGLNLPIRAQTTAIYGHA